MKQAIRDLIFAADHPVFAGHFPDNPIVPGVCLLDAASALANDTWGPTKLSIVRVKFKRSLAPDEPCRMTMTWRDDRLIDFDCRSEQGPVATGLLALRDQAPKP